MDNLVFAINAVLPIILLIVLGNLLVKFKLFDEKFMKGANTFCFKVALPVMLFKNVLNSDFNDINWPFILYCCAAIIVIFFLGLLSVVLFTKDNKKRGVLLQNSFRSNFSFIGIPLAASLFAAGSLESGQAEACAALISAFTIPIFNVLAVVSLSIFQPRDEFGNKQKFPFKKIFLGIIKNPLIIGIAIGFVGLGFITLTDLPNTNANSGFFLYKCINQISNTATPLALISLGGLFKFSAAKALFKEITFGVLSRIIVVPALCLGGAILIGGFSKPEYAAMIALFASPVAVSSAIMATQMDGDGELANQLVVWTTIFSSITIFLLIVIFKTMNYL